MAEDAREAQEPAAAAGKDDLDPSILAAVGQANADISKSAGGAGGGTVGQSEIDDLLKSAAFEDPQGASGGGQVSDAEIEKMLSAAEKGTSVAERKPSPAAAGGPKFELPSFAGAAGEGPLSSIDLLKDVELNVKIELGRSRMLVEEVLKLGEGSVVELDKLAGDPVDVFVNDRLVARGEVLVLNDNFCVRVNEIVAGMRDDVL